MRARIASGQGTIGVAQGAKTRLLENNEDQLIDTHSVAAGLDYVAISPILADWAEHGRLRIEKAMDEEVVAALKLLIREEGTIPALESAHALAEAFCEAKQVSSDKILLINLSGRGDKDIFTITNVFVDNSWMNYLQMQINQLNKT